MSDINWVDKLNENRRNVQEAITPTPFTTTGKAPVVKQQTGGAASLMDVVTASMTEDVKKRIGYYSKQMGIPEERFGVKDNQIVYLDETNNLQAVAPGTLRKMGQAVGPSIPPVAAALGAVVGSPFGPPGMAGAGVLGAMGGQSLKDIIARQTSGQPLTPWRPIREGAIDFIATATGMMIGKGLSRVVATKAAKELGVFIKERGATVTEALRAVNEKYGTKIVLTPAELTNLAKLRSQQMSLEGRPGHAQELEDFYVERSGQAGRALGGFLRDLSPESDTGKVGNLFINKAKEALARIRGERATKGSPYYEGAFAYQEEVLGPTNIAPAIKELNNVLKMFPSGKPTIDRVKKMMGQYVTVDGKKKFVPETDLRQIQNNVKEMLDDEIDSLFRQNKGKLANRLRNVQQTMLKTIDEQNPYYKEARKMWGDLSAPVTDIEGGALKSIVAGKTAKDFEFIGSKFLSAASPQEITKARAHIVALEGGEDIWNATLRGFIEQQWEVAQRIHKSHLARPSLQKAAAPASLWAALVGNRVQFRRIQAALSPDQAKAFKNLMDVFESTGRATNWNSTTAAQQQGHAMLDLGATAGKVRTAARMVFDTFGIPKRLDEAFTRRLTEMNLDMLVKTITSPDSVAELLKIGKRGTPQDVWAVAALKALNIARGAVSGGPGGGDITPSAGTGTGGDIDWNKRMLNIEADQ